MARQFHELDAFQANDDYLDSFRSNPNHPAQLRSSCRALACPKCGTFGEEKGTGVVFWRRKGDGGRFLEKGEEKGTGVVFWRRKGDGGRFLKWLGYNGQSVFEMSFDGRRGEEKEKKRGGEKKRGRGSFFEMVRLQWPVGV